MHPSCCCDPSLMKVKRRSGGISGSAAMIGRAASLLCSMWGWSHFAVDAPDVWTRICSAHSGVHPGRDFRHSICGPHAIAAFIPSCCLATRSLHKLQHTNLKLTRLLWLAIVLLRPRALPQHCSDCTSLQKMQNCEGKLEILLRLLLASATHASRHAVCSYQNLKRDFTLDLIVTTDLGI